MRGEDIMFVIVFSPILKYAMGFDKIPLCAFSSQPLSVSPPFGSSS